MRQPADAVRAQGFRYKHSLGQNFIYDEALLSRLVESAGVEPGDDVLEIGPGSGSLTRLLAARARRVLALELDRDLLPILSQTLCTYPNASVMQGDVMKVDLASLIKEAFGEPQRLLLVANLPYYITTPVLTRLLTERLPIVRAAVMVQKEVAEKMLAQPGEAGYGMLSVQCQYYARVREAMRVPASCFTPQPKVDSAFMLLDLRERPPVDAPDEARFFGVVKAAFSMRRKTVKNNLQGALGLSREQANGCLLEAHIDASSRAETLSLAEFATLARALGDIKLK